MNKKSILNLLILCLIFTACGKKKGQYAASGSFEATEIIVSAQAAGQIMQLSVVEGQAVDSNQVLGYIDTTQLHLKKEQLLAGIQAIDSRTYNISLQIASLKQQLAKQQTELARFQKLVQSNAATQKQVDDLQSAVDVLEKQIAAQTETLQKGNSSLLSEIQSMQIQIEQVEDMLAKSLIVTPAKGVVLAKYVEVGELAGQGRALLKIADLDNIFLRAYITADQLTQMQLNQEVEVLCDFGEKAMRAYKGQIIWISDKAEFTPRTILTKNERSNQVYAVKIAVKNDGYLKIGMYGEVKN